MSLGDGDSSPPVLQGDMDQPLEGLSGERRGTSSDPLNADAPPEGPSRITRQRRAQRQSLPDKVYKSLFQTIRRKDVKALNTTLQANAQEKLYLYSNEFGVSSVECAVRFGSRDVLDAFLRQCGEGEREGVILQAIMFAIRDNKIDVVEYLLDRLEATREARHPGTPDCKARNHAEEKERNGEVTSTKTHLKGVTSMPGVASWSPKVKKKGKYTLMRTAKNKMAEFSDPDFSPDMSPLLLAAQLERYDIIKLLMERVKPDVHPISQRCSRVETCYICTQSNKYCGHRTIEECRRIVEIFQALSSPAYLLFLSGCDCTQKPIDPILESFKLSVIMEEKCEEDAAFGETYKEIGRKCRRFGTDMLGLCRDSNEVDLMLNQMEGLENTNRKGSHAHFPRMQVAIHYGQKEFVAHPHCQQQLESFWWGGLPVWFCSPKLRHLRLALYAVIWLLVAPALFFLYALNYTWAGKMIKTPANKFFSDMLSFLTFLMIIFMEIYSVDPAQRAGKISYYDIVQIIWVLGLSFRFLVVTMRVCSLHCGRMNLEHREWRFLSWLFLLCFWVYIILRLITCLGGRDKKRIAMEWYDQVLLAEIFYGIGSILAISRLFSYFKDNSRLGNLQVSLKKMTVDILSFLALFWVVLSAFALGLTVLYRGYQCLEQAGHHFHDIPPSMPPKSNDSLPPPPPTPSQPQPPPQPIRSSADNDSGPPMEDYMIINSKPPEVKNPSADTCHNEANEYFMSLKDSYKMLFWTVFGYGEINAANLKVIPGEEVAKHRLTEITGYSMYAVYNLVSIVVLLNMLIAMMASSYHSIEINSDMEWKFSRTVLRMSYINEVGCVPPPFNLMISPIRRLLAFLTWVFTSCKYLSGRTNHRSFSMDNQSLYHDLIEKLKKRYWKRRIKDIQNKNFKLQHDAIHVDPLNLQQMYFDFTETGTNNANISSSSNSNLEDVTKTNEQNVAEKDNDATSQKRHDAANNINRKGLSVTEV